MTKILFHSNAPWACTGYGNQTGLFLPELAKHYDVVGSSFYGLEGARIVWNGIPILPGLGGDFGNDYLVDHAARAFGGDPKDGVVITLMDVWVLQASMAKQLNMACIVPVDHDPCPPRVLDFLRLSEAVPIAMSKFGQRKLEKLDALYVPHCIDTDTFKPLDRDECREFAGLDDATFLVGMVAANKGRPSRKGFQQALEAFRLFRLKHENAVLYLQTTMDPNHGQGEDIGAMISALGIPPESVIVPNQYRMILDPFPPATMAKIYGAMDVLLSCSMGEGFGIPVLEAQACGVPGIVTNFSAQPEVCGSGWHVECKPFWTPQLSWQAVPDVDDMVSALNRAIGMSKAEKQHKRDKAREHAMNYSVPTVMSDHMLPALREVQKRLADRSSVSKTVLKKAA